MQALSHSTADAEACACSFVPPVVVFDRLEKIDGNKTIKIFFLVALK